jgi:hypothetical protein
MFVTPVLIVAKLLKTLSHPYFKPLAATRARVALEQTPAEVAPPIDLERDFQLPPLLAAELEAFGERLSDAGQAQSLAVLASIARFSGFECSSAPDAVADIVWFELTPDLPPLVTATKALPPAQTEFLTPTDLFTPQQHQSTLLAKRGKREEDQ